MLTLVFFALLSGIISFGTALWLVRKAGRMGLMDIPNHRSSHDKPTPKGGGIGIVIAVLLALALSYGSGLLSGKMMLIIACAALAVAILGFFSDRAHMSARLRIGIQCGIAAIVVWLVGAPASIELPGYSSSLGPFAGFIAVLWIVALTNFYNFMDGIDGLAAMQAIVAGIAFAAFGILIGERVYVVTGIIISAASAGFFLLNVYPARIFMGDVGSYFLGFMFAALALTHKMLWVPTAIVLSVFIFDTVITLVRRIIGKECWYKAHRSHFYQRAVLLGYDHGRVTGILTLTFFSLCVLACLYLMVTVMFQKVIVVIVLGGLTWLVQWVVVQEKQQQDKINA